MDAFAHRPSERAAAGRRIIRIPQAANRFLQSAASPTDRSRNSGGGVPASRAGFAAAGGVGGIALKTRRIQRTDIVSSCGTTRSVSDTLIGPRFDCGSWVRTTRTTRSTVGVTWLAPRPHLELRLLARIRVPLMVSFPRYSREIMVAGNWQDHIGTVVAGRYTLRT